VDFADSLANSRGQRIALLCGMKELSAARKRTVALQQRAIRFSVAVNDCFPTSSMNYPSQVVWEQLVRAADSTSNNLCEADNGSTNPDFLNKMKTALREAKESKACLQKIDLGSLANAPRTRELGLEQEADELSAIFSTIVTNMEKRLARSRKR
jgi:four helix bundle protein